MSMHRSLMLAVPGITCYAGKVSVGWVSMVQGQPARGMMSETDTHSS